MLDHSFSIEIFPNIQSEPPLTQRNEAICQLQQVPQTEDVIPRYFPG